MACRPFSFITRALLWAILMMSCLPTQAVPAKRIWVELKQPDGTSFQAVFQGDEFLHGFFTAEGWPVVEGEDGYYQYGLVSEEGIQPTRWLVTDKPSTEMEKFLRSRKEGLMEELAALRKKNMGFWLDNRHTTALHAKNLLPGQRRLLVGKRKGLVILVQFSNLQMLDTSPSEIRRMFNQKGYDKNGHIGSVSDYFQDQSYGRLLLDFDVAGPVTLPKTFGYYGSNDPARGGDKYPGAMAAEACRLVDGEVNFADYDWDGDGEVEQVFIVYAGHGESEGAPKHTIWPHKSSLSVREKAGDGEGALILDGVKVDVYACACELAEAEGTHLNGMGTACHEFSHCLGLPDLYDTAYSGTFGMGVWDVMDAGSRNGPNYRGEVPCGYSAFERHLLGWLLLEEVDATRRITALSDLGEEAMAYLVRNPGASDECLIMENHQPARWFAYAGQYHGLHGLMVTNVDYDEGAWKNNLVNTATQRRMGLVPADNDYGTFVESTGRFMPTAEELAGDLFPGMCKVETLTTSSHERVGGRWCHPTPDGKCELSVRLLNIVENDDGTLAFDVVMGDDVPTPTELDACDIGNDGFTAIWKDDGKADTYTLELITFQPFWPFLVESRDTIAGIHEGKYVFCGLQGFKYAFRVRATFNGIASEWSEYCEVELDMMDVGRHVAEVEETEAYKPNGVRAGKTEQGGMIIYRNKTTKAIKKVMTPW